MADAPQLGFILSAYILVRVDWRDLLKRLLCASELLVPKPYYVLILENRMHLRHLYKLRFDTKPRGLGDASVYADFVLL